MNKTIFEMQHYMEINIKRETWLKNLIDKIIKTEKLKDVVDVGCGDGYFSNSLKKMGFHVKGLDGRSININHAKERYKGIIFKTLNIEQDKMDPKDSADLAVCLGLLYHLENPFKAVRNLFKLTKKHCIIETRTAPWNIPIAVLFDEFGQSDDQGLDYIALIPSKIALIKMLYQAGFKFVYESKQLPKHPEFKKKIFTRRMRTCLVASLSKLDIPELKLLIDKKYSINWWNLIQSNYLYRKIRDLKRSLIPSKGH